MKQSEIVRKVLHIVIGAILLGAVYVVQNTYNLSVVLYLGVALLLGLLIVDAWRLEQKKHIAYHHLLKLTEHTQYHAFIFSVSAALIVLGVFNFPIAMAALCMAVFGDAAAGLVGMRWGKHKVPFNKVKTIEGTSANAVVCIIIGILFAGTLSDRYASGLLIGVLMGIVAVIVEFFSDTTEDNFTVPLFTAFLGQVMWWLF